MSATYTPEPKILQLLGKLCAEDLSGEDASLLLSRLKTDERLRGFYVAYLNLHAELMWSTVSREIPADAIPWTDELLMPVRPRQSLRISPVWLAVAATLMLAAYFVGLPTMIGLDRAWRMAENVFSEDWQPQRMVGVEPVATISDSVDPQWSRSTDKLEVGNQKSEITAGESLAIDSGLVELELKQGATLLVEGPAQWTIDGDNAATLSHGKLVAQVPRPAIGFTLKTPSGTIVDLGTEFGVEVVPKGETKLHVLKGEVQFAWNVGDENPVRLSAGESRQIQVPTAGSTPSMEEIPFDAAVFTNLPFAESPSGNALARWREQSSRLRKDPDMVAYYDFEVRGNELRNVANDSLHGTIKSPGKVPWIDGRWRDKGALAFGKNFASATVNHDPALQPDGDWSVAVWLRVDALPPMDTPGGHALIVGKGNYPFRAYSLWLGTGGKFHWVATGPAGGNLLFSSDPIQPNLWHFVVGVIDSGFLRLYVNGQEVGSAKLANAAVDFDSQPLSIGRSLEPDRAEPFTGAIDEIAILRRALTQQEIQSLYQKNQPK